MEVLSPQPGWTSACWSAEGILFPFYHALKPMEAFPNPPPGDAPFRSYLRPQGITHAWCIIIHQSNYYNIKEINYIVNAFKIFYVIHAFINISDFAAYVEKTKVNILKANRHVTYLPYFYLNMSGDNMLWIHEFEKNTFPFYYIMQYLFHFLDRF